MGTEIERKWLVPALPAELAGLSGERIRQGYIVIGAEGDEVRVRENESRAMLTVKSGHGLVRAETEIELSAEQFAALWETTAGRRVAKRRINLPEGVDVDVYDEDLSGLIVAEVEFASEAAAHDFTAPDWFGAEVTEDRRYRNQQLALRGRPQR
ncbi:MAG TPA: CYTH domain-containing protein [Solirubrobacteraceae bacterium]|nr:CYTH domain-containing protein [Solirubrobacteraceae bacterium]